MPIAKVIDSVDVFLIKATRKYFSMVLFITLDNVLTFQSLESLCVIIQMNCLLFVSFLRLSPWMIDFFNCKIWESFLSIE